MYGARHVASTMPVAASALYARNLQALLLLMTRDGEFAPDHDDDIVAGTCVLRDGVPAPDLVREALA